ncbi:DNA phosphorothioation-dependent restriction protein DptH [Halieaceae bacterium IMCC14734]|uniref:DNA phosphorothioation-dependent restriction protein DptH n=1 Tax=Candidatus Litorirhabdus singularis TaxID=2518993 RepID=A0ABT3TKL4_9GAMM|nr:DNA phosphorothioation-dependent restriction protein DptH [Candidatus Litorirhabdus singularis]MCX2982872.1 DNA phosphorothioation-dependent restriction protein DptH [Candidatus Litorirhabdus singularis]
MSVKLFEEFLASYFLNWANTGVEPGFRYQFQSPNLENSAKLYKSFINPELVSGFVDARGSKLAYTSCGNAKLIPVIHNDQDGLGYTENFISFLRDEVAGQQGEFESTALLIIHNSLLDTIVNSAEDLTSSHSVFNPEEIKAALLDLVDRSGKPESVEISRILLEYQFDLITEDQGSMFGFGTLYTAIADGVIEFHELGLLRDPAIQKMHGPRAAEQIRKRLDSNRALYEQIEDVQEHYPDQLADNLPDLGKPFIARHFPPEKPYSWKDLTYDEIRKEQDRNRDQILEVRSEKSATGELIVRTRGASKSALRARHMLLVVDRERQDFDISLEFTGGKIKLGELKIVDSCQVSPITVGNLQLSSGNVNTSLVLIGAMRELPRFFRIDLTREKTSENFKFHCLVLQKGQFNIDAIRNSFLVDVRNSLVKLQSQETTLPISSAGAGSTAIMTEVGQSFNVIDQDVIDFTDISNEVDRIDFEVISGEAKLKFDVEGAAATDVLSLPLLLDLSNKSNLFNDGLFGVYNRTKERVYINNQEVKGTSRSTELLNYEAGFIDGGLLYCDDGTGEQLSHVDLQEHAPALSAAYRALYQYYSEKNTLPSLCGWGPEYQRLVGSVVKEYRLYLDAIPQKQYLEAGHKRVLQLGMAKLGTKEYILPTHPLVLAYYHYLVSSAVSDKSASFFELPTVTLERLNPQGLLPFIYDSEHDFSYVKAEEDNCFWLHCVAHKDANYSYITKLVKDKISEFSAAFDSLFHNIKNSEARTTLIINSVNNYDNHEVFMGVVAHVVKLRTKTFNVHINIYDEELMENEFDRFAEMGSYDRIKQHYGLNTGVAKDHADTIVDMLRTRVTYSKFTHTEVDSQAYAHLTFFRNNQKVKVIDVNPVEKLSGVCCHGLINGEASASEQGNYITGFGLKGVEHSELPHVEIAKLVGRLIHPARESTVEYRDNSAIALAVDDHFKRLLERSYDSSIWTSIIDPKVTLDFFENSENMLLIHYSDQYTSSASYDAITVTRQTDLYDRVLAKEDGGLIGEFNAFNGEWLLQMVTANPKNRKERKGILAAYKLVSCLLAESDITWVPMSAAEMIRVSGNIGLNMSGIEFSRHAQGFRSGPISDDVLFVGIKDDSLYVLPLEVKTGVSYDSKKAITQAQELARYIVEDVLNGDALERKIYRSLFIRQLLMQVDKYLLYSVYPDDYFAPLLETKEWWLQGDYDVAAVAEYPSGFVVANLESDTCLETSAVEVDGILKIEVPYSFIPATISTSLKTLMADNSSTAVAPLADKYFMKETRPRVFSYQEAKAEDEGEEQQPEASRVDAGATEQEAPEIDDPQTTEERETAGVITENSGDSLKVLIGHEVNHNEAVYWEPTNTAKFMNTNSGIIGTMGTGKTQCTKSVVTQLHRSQHLNVDGKPIGMLIFDYKSDYVDDDFMAATSAKKYRLHKLPYNPLSLFGDTPMLPVHTARGFSETMGKAFGLGQKQLLRLRKLIAEAYELAGISKSDPNTWSKSAPTVADVWSLFISQEKVEEDSLYAALESLHELEIFEDDVTKCTSLYELIDGITVVELAGYPPQIQNLVVALTLDLFYSQMQKQGKPKVRGDYRQITKLILVDEADNFMSQDFPSLRRVLKEGREYGVGVILSTQDITHFKTKENDYSSYILSWVIHRVSQIKNQDIKSLFNKDDKSEQEHLMKTIRGLDKHYSLYVDGDKKVVKIKDRAFWELFDGI